MTFFGGEADSAMGGVRGLEHSVSEGGWDLNVSSQVNTCDHRTPVSGGPQFACKLLINTI